MGALLIEGLENAFRFPLFTSRCFFFRVVGSQQQFERRSVKYKYVVLRRGGGISSSSLVLLVLVLTSGCGKEGRILIGPS